jgi:hypothetical protein
LSYDPTPTQALLLFGLLARHGACAQAELMPKVKKADREALIKEKLITSTPKRPLQLTLEDLGWAWAAENLGRAKLPPAHRTLRDLCARVSEHLAKRRDASGFRRQQAGGHFASAATCAEARQRRSQAV